MLQCRAMRTIATILALTAALCGIATHASADATADGRAVSDAFAKAVAAGDVPAILALYRDDASVIWPGQGEEAKGKAAIEPLARNLVAAAKNGSIVLKSQESIPLGDGYIANVGRWENTVTMPDGKKTTVVIRTSEVLAKTDGKWLYLVDHASIGAPPPPAKSQPRRRARH
jgi:uncharacterized protein (TIGR02246 family)